MSLNITLRCQSDSVTMTWPTLDQVIENDDNMTRNRSAGGVVYTVIHGPVFYTITRVFESLTEDEFSALMAFYEYSRTFGGEVTYEYTPHGGSLVVVPCRIIEAPRPTRKMKNIIDVSMKFEQEHSPDQTTDATAGALGPTITSSRTVNATSGTALSYTIAATGTGGITYGSSSLPSGLSQTGAVISGTISSAGTYSIMVTATDSNGTSLQGVLIIVTSPVAISSPLTASGVAGQLFTYSLTATGAPPLTLSATSLPSGLSFSPYTGVISGTLPSAGTYNITLGATNTAGSDTQTLVLTVGGPPVITSPVIADAVIGTAFLYQATATGSGTITWAATGLLPGLSFDATLAKITGTPTGGTTSNAISITATNAVGSATIQLVVQLNGPPTITSPTTASGAAGGSFTYRLTATGTSPITLSMTSLPSGLGFNPATGYLTGTPSAAGTYTVTMTAVNAFGTATQTLTITVLGAPTITTFPLDFYALATGSFNITFAATGSPTIGWSTSGTVPTGVTVTDNVITGIPDAGVGDYSFSMIATNGVGSDTQTVSLHVGARLTAPTTTAFYVGTATTNSWGTNVPFSGDCDLSSVGGSTPITMGLYGSLHSGVTLNSPSALHLTYVPSAVTTFVQYVQFANYYGILNVGITLISGYAPYWYDGASLGDLGTYSSGSGLSGLVNLSGDFWATGDGTITYAVTSGALPANLVLNNDGSFGTTSGGPTSSDNGTYSVGITASSEFGSSTELACTLVVAV